MATNLKPFSSEVVIHIDRLSKRYGKLLALNQLSLDVLRGEIFGYLGPNGAGKTTTIRMLLDLIRPTSGQATIFGLDVQANPVAVHQRLGNLPGELSLWNQYTGWQVMEYLGGLRGGMNRAYVGELAEQLDMDMNRRVKECSSGMKRKLGLIQAMMHKPDLLILDEPTNGLDPLVQQTFYKLMEEVRDEGRTVFMSSHILPEVEHVCDRVGILRGGVLKAVERISDLKQVSFRWMTLHVADEDSINPDDFAAIEGVSDVSRLNGGAVRFRVTGDLDPVIKTAARYHVHDLQYVEPSLEEIFLEYYGESSHE
ncbi:MAG: ABC transporter ATP-binding protein [Anaerolineae bacterium]|nr:ABC transporter ATP-binding protein [Anaerolineae bacterium]